MNPLRKLWYIIAFLLCAVGGVIFWLGTKMAGYKDVKKFLRTFV